MDLPLAGDDFRRSQKAEGFHRWNGRTIQDGSACLEGSRRDAGANQRWGCCPGTSALLRRAGRFPDRADAGTGNRTSHPRYSCLLPEHDQPTHPSQVGRYVSARRSPRLGTGLAAQAHSLTNIQRPHGRTEGHQQAQEASAHSPGEECLANTRRIGTALSNHRADCAVLRFADQRDPWVALDGLRFQAVGCPDPAISGRQTTQQVEDRVFAGRSPAGTGLHSGAEEMARAMSRVRDNGFSPVRRLADPCTPTRFVPTIWYRRVCNWDLGGSGSTRSATPTVRGWTKPELPWVCSRNSCVTRIFPPRWTSMAMRQWKPSAKPIGLWCRGS